MEDHTPNKSEQSQPQTPDEQQSAAQAGPSPVPLAAEAPAGAALDKDTRLWGMLCHLGGLFGWIGPLIIWLIKREDHPFIDAQGKAALNFQISMAIYSIVAGVLVLVFVGIILLVALGIFNLIMVIMASIKANEGQSYRYPLTIQFIK